MSLSCVSGIAADGAGVFARASLKDFRPKRHLDLWLGYHAYWGLSGAPSGPGVPNTETLLIPFFCNSVQVASWSQSEGRGGLASLAQRSETKF